MKIFNWLFVFVGIAGLIMVRMVEDTLFYDPLLNYFHVANKKLEMPGFIWSKLIFHHILRFTLNLAFSALVLQGFFSSRKYTVQGLVLITLVFTVIFPIYLYCLYTRLEPGYLFTFYMRRFVIQPVILLLIIPLFYYRKMLLKGDV